MSVLPYPYLHLSSKPLLHNASIISIWRLLYLRLLLSCHCLCIRYYCYGYCYHYSYCVPFLLRFYSSSLLLSLLLSRWIRMIAACISVLVHIFSGCICFHKLPSCSAHKPFICFAYSFCFCQICSTIIDCCYDPSTSYMSPICFCPQVDEPAR